MSELTNPGTGPQVYTKDGRTIAAGERLEVDKLDTVGKAAVSSGRLVFEEDKDEPQATDAPPTSEDEPSAKGTSTDAESTTTTARRSPGGRK